MKGLIFIPDISGFTNFVNNNPIETGAAITSNLLQVIIESNPLQLEISEIEGDAILFYKQGAPISLQLLMDGFAAINRAFTERFNYYKQLYNLKEELSLKLVVHYGEIKVYNVLGFKKLYGQAVVETHSLLKNGIGQNEYVLITDAYLEALAITASNVLVHHDPQAGLLSSPLIAGIRSVAYHLFPNARRHLVLHPTV